MWSYKRLYVKLYEEIICEVIRDYMWSYKKRRRDYMWSYKKRLYVKL